MQCFFLLIDDNPIQPIMEGIDVESGISHVDEPRLYNIVSTQNPQDHTLTIEVNTPGFEIFTFTFG